MGETKKRLEMYLVKQVEAAGGFCLKCSTDGMYGFPDRIVVLPEGLILWVLIKPTGSKLTVVEKYRRKQMMLLDHKVNVCYGRVGIDIFLREYKIVKRIDKQEETE